MAQAESLDAHERPPTFLRNVYKYYHKLPISAIESDPRVLDLNPGSKPAIPANNKALVECGKISTKIIAASCYKLADTPDLGKEMPSLDAIVYEVKNIPG